ncbi:MAG: ABC transporter permease, partial [Chloroflexota bacterium]|nr:ABC transporter permease [Chloroflexota bacterium]
MTVVTQQEKSAALDLTRKPRSPVTDAFNMLFKNKVAVGSGIFLIFLILVAIFAPAIAPEGVDDQKLPDNYMAPGSEYLLGADQFGRDVLSRVIYGTRVSLSVAFTASIVSLIIGVTYGLIAGYFGGMIDNVMMRIVDILYGFPFLIFVILLQVYFKAVAARGGEGMVALVIDLDRKMGGMLFIFLALGALSWIGMARLARGQVLSYKEMEFVVGARSIGASDIRIIFRHLLPNILGPCIVLETMAIPGYIFTEAFLSFIGLGVNAPTPSWGIMVNNGYRALRAHPHVLWPPAIALVITSL